MEFLQTLTVKKDSEKVCEEGGWKPCSMNAEQKLTFYLLASSCLIIGLYAMAHFRQVVHARRSGLCLESLRRPWCTLERLTLISTLMRDGLQWLRIGEHIRFRLSILVHKCLNNSAPPYLVDKIRPLSDDCNRSRLRSSNLSNVFVPRTKTKMGDRAFLVTGPRTWNSLSATIWETKTLLAFKKQFKLYLIGSLIPSIRYCADSERSWKAS